MVKFKFVPREFPRIIVEDISEDFKTVDNPLPYENLPDGEYMIRGDKRSHRKEYYKIGEQWYLIEDVTKDNGHYDCDSAEYRLFPSLPEREWKKIEAVGRRRLSKVWQRRAEFCYKTLQFLVNNRYVDGAMNRDLFIGDHTKALTDSFHIHEYGDSVHNHIKKEGDSYIHRKGSTELNNDTIVIPLSMTRGSLLVKKVYDDPMALNSCAHGAGRKLSRTDTLKYWHSSLKQKERKEYMEKFGEMLGRDGKFSNGYLQEFDFAYKGSENILTNQPYLRKVTETRPIVTFKFTEI